MKNREPRFILTFEWHSLLSDIRRNVWLIFMAGCVAFMGIYIAQRSAYSPRYTSSATLAVRVRSETSSTIGNLSVSADTAVIYAAVFQGESMKALAAQSLGLDEFPGEVTASVVSEINLMTVSVTADDPELAYYLLKAILSVYPQISDAIFSNTVIDVIESPHMPEEASNQLSVMYQGALIVLAMMVQGCLIVLVSLLRETVKHEDAFEQMIEGRLLGTITHERAHGSLRRRLFRKKDALLIDSAFASLRFCEDYHKIATKLEYMKKSQNAAVFAITSVAENEGKSTITVNLALALSERGYRVAVLDLDLRKPSMYKIMDCRSRGEMEFGDVLSGAVSVQDYRFYSYRPGVWAALGRRCRRDAADCLGSERMKTILDDIRERMDFVLIDTPPALASADAAVIARLSDCTILAVRTDRTAAADINDTISTLANVGGNLAGCILNDVYKPFTFWGQMGADEDGRRDTYYRSGRALG